MDTSTNLLNRRKFMQQTGLGAAALGLAPAFLPGQDGVAPGERVQVALIGCKGKGFEILNFFLRHGGVDCVMMCDVDANILAERAAKVEADYGQRPKQEKDFRRVLDNRDVQAVIVATPDHWHCLPMIYACEAGKDVYVEKPLANSIEECNRMVWAARRHKRVVQVGQQQRSGLVWKSLMQVVHSGQLGTLRKVNLWANFNYGVGTPVVPDGPVPEGVDYDMWLGPAPERPFNSARFHGKWRLAWDYGGGLMTDWGVHLMDMALWAGHHTAGPTEVLAYGENLSFQDHFHETYDTMSVTYPMKGYMITWQHTAGVQTGPHGKNYGVEIVGDHGSIVADRAGWKLVPEGESDLPRKKLQKSEFAAISSGQDMESHVANFLECLKTRQDPACPVELGRHAAVFTHVANIAVRTGEHRLRWNDEKNEFIDSKDANALVTPEYRRPWKLPKV